MHPVILGSVPSYFAMWAVADVICLGLGASMARRANLPRWRFALALLLLFSFVGLGSKLLYMLENAFFPFDDYVPLELRGRMHGFRIPGGILLLALALPLVCWSLKLPWVLFGDTFVPLVTVLLICVRVGCFLNGCCFGRVSSLPWAIGFPRGSSVYDYHLFRGLISPAADFSLRVQPLQLYFTGAALLILGVLVYLHRLPRQLPGRAQLTFYTLFFVTTLLLEPLRENHLTLNHWIVFIATAVPLGLLVGQMLRQPDDALRITAVR